MGERAPNDAELGDIDKFVSEAEKAEVNTNITAEPIDNYWFKVLKNSVVIGINIIYK